MRCLILLSLLLPGAAPVADWRVPDAARLLVIDTGRGRVVIEMEPRAAPRAVERVALLARRGTYDGLLFHRVIEGFVAQTGNPNNRDGGGTELPDLKPEFMFRLGDGAVTWVRQASDGREGIMGSLPVASGGGAGGWGAHCTGSVGMGRQADPSTANSEIYIMRAPARRLDHDYTVFGRVLVGQAVIDALQIGEPPVAPDRMVRVRIAADMAPLDRPNIEVMDTAGPGYNRRVARKRRERGADFSICDALPPVRPRA